MPDPPPRSRVAARRWGARLLPVALLSLVACQAGQDDTVATSEPAPASDSPGGAEASGGLPDDEAPRSDAVRPLPLAPVSAHIRDRDTGGPSGEADRGDDDPVAAWHAALDDDAARLGQLLMLRVYGGGVDEADPRNEALYGVATPREVIETLRPGGVLLFRTDGGEDTGNLRDPQQVRDFTDDLREASGELGPPVTVAIDQEGGPVDRIGHFGTPYPTARELAGDPEAAAEHAEVTVTELAALGVDMNFGPVADVDSEPDNPIIGARAYSEEPAVVAEMVLAQLDRYEDGGVVPVLKHFPGHGDTTEDSHHTLPLVDADRDLLEQRELVPFVEAIAAGAPAIMTAHLQLPELAGSTPTSMSSAVVTDLLRDDLDFDGLIVTDSLEMAGARHDRPDDRVALHALLAGHDLLVLPPTPQASLERLQRALVRDRLPEERVEASLDRLLHLKAAVADETGDRPPPDVVGPAPAGGGVD